MLALVITFSSPSFAGEPDYVPYDSITVSADLPKPYGKTKLEIICSKTDENLSRQITSFKFITGFGEIPIPKKAYSDLRNPGYPKMRAWSPAKELEIWIQFPYQADEYYDEIGATIVIRNRKVDHKFYGVFDEKGDRMPKIQRF